MKFSSAVAILVAAVVPTALAQDVVYDLAHNASSLTGTWSSGSQQVRTGAGFANPANRTFQYPKVAGISYSFIHTGPTTGNYELARYRFESNGSEPTCITGVSNFAHGDFEMMPNGSIVLTPFGDGFQQIQAPCAANSNFVELYNITELISYWRIYFDATIGINKLHLFQFDGQPLAPQFQISATPDMLPPRSLWNGTAKGSKSKRAFVKRSAAPRSAVHAGAVAGVLAGAAAIAAVAL